MTVFRSWLWTIGILSLVHQIPAHAQMHSEKVVVLFDGSSLDAWESYTAGPVGAGWKIADGALYFDGSGGGDIVTRDSFADFELSFEWKVSPGGNSGVMYRVGLGDNAPYFTGPEYQILDDQQHADGRNTLTSAASLYGLYAATEKSVQPVGQWNRAKIIVHGNHVEHWLNDRKVVEAEIGSEDWNERISNSKFKDWPKFATLSEGRICLQDHGDEVWYRNIVVRVRVQSRDSRGSISAFSGMSADPCCGDPCAPRWRWCAPRWRMRCH